MLINRQVHLSSTFVNQHSFTFRIENDTQILSTVPITNLADGRLLSVSSSPVARHLVRREIRSLCNFQTLPHHNSLQSWLVGVPELNHSYFRKNKTNSLEMLPTSYTIFLARSFSFSHPMIFFFANTLGKSFKTCCQKKTSCISLSHLAS